MKHMSSPVAIVAPEGFGWHQSIERDQSKENQLIECVAAQVVVVGDEGRPSQEFLLQWYQQYMYINININICISIYIYTVYIRYDIKLGSIN